MWGVWVGWGQVGARGGEGVVGTGGWEGGAYIERPAL